MIGDDLGVYYFGDGADEGGRETNENDAALAAKIISHLKLHRIPVLYAGVIFKKFLPESNLDMMYKRRHRFCIDTSKVHVFVDDVLIAMKNIQSNVFDPHYDIELEFERNHINMNFDVRFWERI